jgi:propane monooxygenase coupling protein
MPESDSGTRPGLLKVRTTIGISLIGGEEAKAAVELIRDEVPNAKIVDHDCYYKIEHDELLEFDMAKLSERLGRQIKVHDFLVCMASYYGRIVVQEDSIQIHSEILPERFRD